MKPRISVFGSHIIQRAQADKNRSFELKGLSSEFAGTCRELGRRLARERVILNTCSDTEGTADLYVTLGFLDEAKASGLQDSFVHLYRPAPRRSQECDGDAVKPIFEDLLIDKAYSGLIKLFDDGCHSGNIIHLRALRDSDCVLTVGGLNNTYAAGTAAALAGKRLVPVAGFGGASARLLAELGRELRISSETDIAALRSPCTVKNGYAVLDTAVRLAVRREKPRVFIIHGHSDDWRSVAEWITLEIGLTVIDMQTEGKTGETMPQRFENNASSVTAAIAVVTPDDVGWARRDEAWQCRARGRQNVWLEVGWFWGSLGRDRVMLLIKRASSSPEIECPSDLQGLDFAEYAGDPLSVRERILRFLRQVEGVES